MTRVHPRFYTEYHANVRAVSVLVHSEDVQGTVSVVSVDGTRAWLEQEGVDQPLMVAQLKSDEFACRKPIKAVQSQDACQVRLQLASPLSDGKTEPSVQLRRLLRSNMDDTELSVPLGSRELGTGGLECLCCRSCQSVLTRVGDADKVTASKSTVVHGDSADVVHGQPHFSKCRDLPSEYWQEFLDCWVCHPDEGAPKEGDHQRRKDTDTENHLESHLSKYGDIHPAPSVLMIGNSYFLVHKGNIRFGDAVSVVDCVPVRRALPFWWCLRSRWPCSSQVSGDNVYKWTLECARCHALVGEAWQRSLVGEQREDGANMDRVHAVRIAKYATLAKCVATTEG
jgi:hypothetical protein